MANKNYIDNETFEKLIFLYQENPEEHEAELLKLLDLLINNILLTFKFRVDPDDAKQDCYLLIFKIIKNFKPRKGTAFNYFTTIIINNLKLLYTRDKKYNVKINEYIERNKEKLLDS